MIHLKVLEFETRSTLSHFVQNSLRKRLCACPTTDYLVIMTENFILCSQSENFYMF